MKEKNCFLFDYFDNHPLGIIYDWIRNNEPTNTIIIKHINFIPYCKSGRYRLKNNLLHKKIYKFIRVQFILLFLRFKGYEILDLDKFFSINNKKNYKFASKLSNNIKKEILRDFICNKESQASYIALRYNFIYKDYEKRLNYSLYIYEKFFNFLVEKYNPKNFYVFNGRALRQKIISFLSLKNNLELHYIERNMWNKGRTIISNKRIQSFDYLKTNKCDDYLDSVHDISVEELYESVMTKQYKSVQSDLFEKGNNKKLVSYLSGSSDEYCAFTDEVMLEDCKTQIELVKFISGFCYQNNIDFLLRVHPNSRKKSKIDLSLWNQLESLLQNRKQLFFPAHSNVNTYSIISESDILITNGSTVTIEACLVNKRVALCGFNGLRNYNAAFKPKNKQTLADFIINELFNTSKNYLSPITESKKYLLDELQSGRKLNFYSMITQKIKL